MEPGAPKWGQAALSNNSVCIVLAWLGFIIEGDIFQQRLVIGMPKWVTLSLRDFLHQNVET